MEREELIQELRWVAQYLWDHGLPSRSQQVEQSMRILGQSKPTNARPCRYRLWDGKPYGKQKSYDAWRNGRFHQWSTTYQEIGDGAAQYPVAIVEDEETHQVRLPNAEDVEFLEV